MVKESNIILKPMTEVDKEEFKEKIQESFCIAIKEYFGKVDPIPSDEELEEAFAASDNECFCIFEGNTKIGGTVIRVDNKTNRNCLDLFFIYAGQHGKGLGLKAWKAIEKKFPETKVWETVTPYFEKRNINFYVNKCGFHIVEFCNKHHNCKEERYNRADGESFPGEEEFFRFEKIMSGF